MQGDLFGSASALPSVSQNAQRASFLERTRLTLRLDQGLVALIALLVFYVLIFSFGVEKGKRLGLAELQAERTKRESMVRELRAKIFSPKTSRETEISVELPASITGESVVSLPSEPRAIVPAGQYTIQLITYKSQSAADREIQKLREKGHQGFVIPSGRYFQVCANGFTSRQEAQNILRQLKAQKIAAPDAYVRPIPQ